MKSASLSGEKGESGLERLLIDRMRRGGIFPVTLSNGKVRRYVGVGQVLQVAARVRGAPPPRFGSGPDVALCQLAETDHGVAVAGVVALKGMRNG